MWKAQSLGLKTARPVRFVARSDRYRHEMRIRSGGMKYEFARERMK